MKEPTRMAFDALDTTTDARTAQREAYRKLGGPERVAIQFRLGALVRGTALAGILRRHPEYSDAQARMALRRLLFGDDLVRRAWPDEELIDP